jgi:hypothetical protein
METAMKELTKGVLLVYLMIGVFNGWLFRADMSDTVWKWIIVVLAWPLLWIGH